MFNKEELRLMHYIIGSFYKDLDNRIINMKKTDSFYWKKRLEETIMFSQDSKKLLDKIKGLK